MKITPTPTQERDHLRKHLEGIKASALRWLNRSSTKANTTDAVRHLRGLVVDALKPPLPVFTQEDLRSVSEWALAHIALDDQPMVEELDPEETQDPTTYVYEIETGAYYWVIATNPAEALKILDETMDNWDEECGPGTGNMTIHVPPLERLNSLCFYDENENTHARFAAEYNRDPSPRMMACSEW